MPNPTKKDKEETSLPSLSWSILIKPYLMLVLFFAKITSIFASIGIVLLGFIDERLTLIQKVGLMGTARSRCFC